jgi:hypothetical protein
MRYWHALSHLGASIGILTPNPQHIIYAVVLNSTHGNVKVRNLNAQVIIRAVCLCLSANQFCAYSHCRPDRLKAFTYTRVYGFGAVRDGGNHAAEHMRMYQAPVHKEANTSFYSSADLVA